MYDFRDEFFYRVFLILIITSNCQYNNKGKKILTIKKLESIFFLLQNHTLMRYVIENLNLGALVKYESTLYDDALRINDDLEHLGTEISFLVSNGSITISNNDGCFYIETSIKPEELDSQNKFIFENLKLIKKLASQPETKLLKAILKA
ncbi:hypothetical protein ACFWHB_06335 [Aeromonas mytilicola subsp. aquatica]|uniref:hypothetical protein n=1 Tax=Aeromonas mytilicola TaxID=3377113 RepID=UPI0037BEFE84